MSAKQITETNFVAMVQSGTALVDFWASWCGPCKALLPIVDAIAEEVEGSGVLVGKVNVDENQLLAEQYEVMTIPTVILFKDGEEVTRFVNQQQKEPYLKALSELK